MADAWYLMKAAEENEVYGPTSLVELKSWADSAIISPMDRLSRDGQSNWLRAPMLAELGMDWLVELEDGSLYGPTSVSTIVEFLDEEEIDESVVIINCKEGYHTTIAECEEVLSQPRRSDRPEEKLEDMSAEAKLERLEEEHALLRGHFDELREKYIRDVGREP